MTFHSFLLQQHTDLISSSLHSLSPHPHSHSFSATGAIEGAYAIQTGDLLELSMQQLVDCDDLDGGCQGGEMQQAFVWTRQNGGLCSLSEYPYTSGNGEADRHCQKCQVSKQAGTHAHKEGGGLCVIISLHSLF